MKRNHLTLIIQPDWTVSRYAQKISSVSFHKRVIVWFFIGISLLVAFGVHGSRIIIENRSIKLRIDELEQSNQQLARLEHQIDDVWKEETIIRDFLGIEAWDQNFDINERMGKGGSESDDFYEMPPLDAVAEIEEMVDNRPLHLRVYSLREDISELNTILSKMTETLKCRPTIMPVRDNAIWITSGFGWRKSPFTGLRQFHKGLDISGRKGAPIIATADGVVSKVGYNRFIGNYVRIKHDERYETGYGHLLKTAVKKNELVKRGQVVGYMGTTGMSTGYHLHYVVVDNNKRVNPYNFILNRNEIQFAAARSR